MDAPWSVDTRVPDGAIKKQRFRIDQGVLQIGRHTYGLDSLTSVTWWLEQRHLGRHLTGYAWLEVRIGNRVDRAFFDADDADGRLADGEQMQAWQLATAILAAGVVPRLVAQAVATIDATGSVLLGTASVNRSAVDLGQGAVPWAHVVRVAPDAGRMAVTADGGAGPRPAGAVDLDRPNAVVLPHLADVLTGRPVGTSVVTPADAWPGRRR